MSFAFSSNPSGAKKTVTGKRLGRPPKKGTHLHTNSLGAMAVQSSASDLVQSDSRKGDLGPRKRSPTSSPEREGDNDDGVKRKKTLNKR